MSSLVRDTALTFSSRVVYALFQLLLQFGLALYLGAADQGSYFTVMQLALAGSILLGLGMGQSSLYFLQNRRDSSGPIISSHFLFSLTILIPAGGGLLYFGAQALSLFPLLKIPPVFFLMALGIAGLMILYQDGRQLLLGADRRMLFNGVTLIVVIINVLGLLALVKLTPQVLWAALWAAMIALGCGVLIVYGRLFRSFPLRPALFDTTFGPRLRYGIFLWTSTLIAFVNYRLTFFLVRFFLGATHSGHYSMAIMLAELVWFVPDAVSLMLFPQMASLDDRANDELSHRVSRNTVFLSLLLSLAVAAAGTIFLLTVGGSYRPALLPFLLLLPGTLVFSCGKVLAISLMCRKKLLATNAAAGLIFILNTTGSLLLIPRLGMTGAAIASTLGYTAGTLATLLYYRRLTGTPVSAMLLLRKQDWQHYRELLERFFRR